MKSGSKKKQGICPSGIDSSIPLETEAPLKEPMCNISFIATHAQFWQKIGGVD